MRHVAVITVEGVLSQTPDYKTTQPQPWARQLYQALKHEYRLILLSGGDDEETRWWLNKEHMGDFSLLVPYVAVMSYPDWRVDQVRQMLADGWEFGLVYDTDDEVIHEVNELGVPAMRVSPSTRRSGWRDHTTEVRAWGDVVGYSG